MSTVTITIIGSSNSYDIAVLDRDGQEHSYSLNGVYTYQGQGVSVIYAHDFGTGQSIDVQITDPLNVIIDFDNPDNPGSGSDAPENWDPTYPDASSMPCGRITFIGDNASVRPTSLTCTVFDMGTEAGTTEIQIRGVSTYYRVWTYSGRADGDIQIEFPQISGYTLVADPQYRHVSDATYRYTGTLPSASRPTTEAKPYVYAGGAWKLADEKIWLGEWKEGVFHVLRAAGAIEEEPNTYGTTAIISNYTTEQNSHGTTVVIE